MSKPVVLVTGANGEIGRSLLQTVAAHGGFEVITLDLTLPPDSLRSLVVASYAGNIMDRYLLDQVAAHHEVDMVFHLAALLSARGERDPELAHQVNVEGTLNVLRMAQNQSARLARPVRFIFPETDSMSRPAIVYTANNSVPAGQTVRVARVKLAFEPLPGSTCRFEVKDAIRKE